MPKLPAVSGKNLLRALGKAGFSVVRQAGSHVVIEHEDGRSSVVPVHANADLPPGTLAGILRDIDISPDDLRKLL